ncbi:alpha-mannosidase [Sediminibacillus massiliensis]|uniref:alpha-mannosidase n=1 Tax=Sediminibacillus massiliensis TaxID=1926277 RepID=UPI0009885E5C|nr:alpha-mannosidase [Sediminibacillus massiliensis]
MYFTEEKIKSHLQDIKETIYRDTQDIQAFKYQETDFGAEEKEAHKPSFDDSSWKDFFIGDSWGGYDKGAWFRTTVPIPEDWKDQKLVLQFHVGPRDGAGSTAETLLYVNGKPLQGIDIWHEDAWLPHEYKQGGTIHIALKAWSGVLNVPDYRRFKLARLAVVDEPAERYFYQADTVLKAIEELDKNAFRRSRILKALNESMQRVDFLKPKSDMYYRSIEEAADYLEGKIKEMAEVEEMKPKVVTLGHSHIDMAWLWRLVHSREKASRTFSTVLNLMRQYPEYRYIHTSPQLYKYLKEDYPEIYEQIKERISSGEWEITGGMWIEPDTNIPNGESLIRQILLGKQFMKQEFGVDTKVVWLPDVFGYSWALPQIMKKSGIETFMTTKISWSQYNRFPHDTFNWRGMDGTEILTHFITTPERDSHPYTYNGMVEPYSVKGVWDSYKQKDINDELLIAFGWGDGGGGPTKEMIESARAMKNLPGIPKVEMGKAEPYFKRLHDRLKEKKVPVWDGELYLEYHRGTYTSQASLKRANRKAEITYHNAEWLGVVNHLQNGYKPASSTLREGWEMLLLNQFHDILPGSSIRQVNEDARKDYQTVQEIGDQALVESRGSITNEIKADHDSLVVFNGLSYNRDGIIEVPVSNSFTESMTVEDGYGNKAPAQLMESGDDRKLAVEAKNVPALGYKTFKITERNKKQSSLVIQKDYLENDYYAIRLNDHGQMTSIYDKRAEREVLSGGTCGNVFQAFEDKPMKFDAWDVDLFYQEKMREVTDLIGVKVVEKGPLRSVLCLQWSFYDSLITQNIILYKNSSRIDFQTEIDWQEKQTLLKVAFPVNVRSTKATYDIQFGNIERPTHWNTSWDYAKFEVAGQKWVDVSEGNYGVALLNDCKYGHDVKDSVIRLTLIKSSISPDETADRCKHQFTYSLLPHQFDWKNGHVIEEGYNLNNPLLAAEVRANKTGKLDDTYQFASIDSDHIILETVKEAEQDGAVIVRLYETKQYRSKNVKLSFAHLVTNAVECNLIEEEEKELSFDGKTVTFDINPYEIKTFKLWF